MAYKFKELVDVRKLQELTDELYKTTGIPSAIIDMDGEILTGSGWQRICTDFHRRHPEIERDCIASDVQLRKELDAGEPFVIYECPRGMVDASSPVIIDGVHVANVFAGQLFLDPPDAAKEQFFREQAHKFGLDEEDYIKAYREIPVFPIARFRNALCFLAKLAELVANLGLTRKRELEAAEQLRAREQRLQESEARLRGLLEASDQSRQALLSMAEDQQAAEAATRESEASYRALVEGLPDVVMRFDPEMRHRFTSANVEATLGIPATQFLGKTHREMGFPETMCEFWEEAIRTVFDTAVPRETEFTVDGTLGPVIFDWRLLPEFDNQGHVHSVLSIARDVTAYRKAEERYQMLFREMLDGFALHEILCDEQGQPADYRFLAVNPAFERMTGMKSEEIVDRTVRDVLPGTEPHWIDTYGNVALTGEPILFENYSQDLGKYFEVTTFRPAPNQFACIFADITERKRAEVDLQEKHLLIENIINSSVDLIFVKDRQLRTLICNNAFAQALGKKPSDLIGKTDIENGWDRDFVKGDPAKGIRGYEKDDLEALSGKKIHALPEFANISGVDFVFDTIKLPLRNNNGEIIGMLGISRDVTERTRLEESLRETQSILQSALNQSVAGIAIADAPSGKLRYVNDAGLLIRGGTRETVVNGVGIDEYISAWKILDLDGTPLPPDDVPLARAIRYGEKSSREFIIRRTEGDDRFVLANAAPIMNAQGNITAGIVVFLDITDRKKADEEKAKLQAQLLQAQKMESVGRLAGGVAHDFNNLLAVILGYAEIVTSELPPDSPFYEPLQEISNAGERAKDLVWQLLAFSRKQTLETRVLDINSLVSDTSKMLRRVIGENINIQLHLAAKPLLVKADPSQLQQVLMNLAVNARDAMPDRGTLTIETAAADLDTHYVQAHAGIETGPYTVMMVSDTGGGMDADTLRQIFDPFFTTKELGKGTGLGLATVHGIIKQHGGDIQVYSEPGRGTTFKVYLPEVLGTPGGRTAESETYLRGRGETILVLEDEEAVRKIVSAILDNLGYTVIMARDAEECFDFARKLDHVDLLLTDVVMPGLNGREVCDRLTEIRPGIQTLFMSGYTENAIAHHGVLDEGVHFIHKPFSAVLLSRKIREILDR